MLAARIITSQLRPLRRARDARKQRHRLVAAVAILRRVVVLRVMITRRPVNSLEIDRRYVILAPIRVLLVSPLVLAFTAIYPQFSRIAPRILLLSAIPSTATLTTQVPVLEQPVSQELAAVVQVGLILRARIIPVQTVRVLVVFFAFVAVLLAFLLQRLALLAFSLDFFLFFSELLLLFFERDLGVEELELGEAALALDGGFETSAYCVHGDGREYLTGTFFFAHAHVDAVQALVHTDTEAGEDFFLCDF